VGKVDNHLVILSIALNLTPQQARILDFLMRRHLATSEDLMEVTNGYVQTAISRVKERLRGTGVKIDSRYNLGYSLSAESRQVIDEKLSAYRAAADGSVTKGIER
jgi:biotin operon repressor